ncbi:extracellular solute-binding protein [Bauldia sp.]|uniref:extracellular solute-binding protein n=1 Tax=Bauldia sp. TaxID=2575872 RepID=UPI003BAAE890
MIGRRGLTRRTALQVAGAGALAAALPLPAMSNELRRTHGLAVLGDLKYPPDFAHLQYVNPDAPRGGELKTQAWQRIYNQNFNTFNTLNMHVLSGDGAFGMEHTYATLMDYAWDEPRSVYGYAAEAVEVSDDQNTLRFLLRPEARFHDGTPITAADVVFSIEKIRDQGHPNISTELKGIIEVVAEDDRTIRIQLAEDTGRGLPVTIAAMVPIFSAAWWEGRDFTASLSEAPLGSGPLRVRDYSFGSFIEYERVPDFWAADVAVMVGRFNFDRLRFDYFRDRVPAFESFKKGLMTFREEFTSRIWARDYNFPAVSEGRVQLDELPDGRPSGAQGWFFNTRRPHFADPRVRHAIATVFDFEWTNQNIMFGSYDRTTSFFENSPLKAEGLPGADELALLEPLRDQVDPAVFEEPVVPPVSDGTGRDRSLRRQALALLQEAGHTLSGNTLLKPDGNPLTFEFLGNTRSFEPHHNAYINNLRSIGIEATYRVVEAAQYTARLDTFDFDVVVVRFNMGLAPDEAIYQFFRSDSAAQNGSNNLAGIADPAVDVLLDRIVHADTWEDFVAASRALDRVLRAGYYWVPQWYKPTHWIAYWDMYQRPETKPLYDRAVIDTWWFDADKAAAIGKAG